MDKIDSEEKYAAVNINVLVNEESNELLTKSAKRAGRTKRKEAAMRLQDHLQLFSDIATQGKRFPE